MANPIVSHVLLMVGWLREDDKMLEDGAQRVCPMPDRSAFKAALTERLIQAGARIIKSDFMPTVITEENLQNNSLMQRFIDPALGLKPFVPGGESRLDFIRQGNRLYLKAQVSTV